MFSHSGTTMRRSHALAGLAILLLAAAFKPAVPPEQRSAILISWDGAGRERVREAVAAGKLPNLARLTREGALVDIEVTGHATDTKPGHAQMLSGYDPSITGVYTNDKFRPIPRGYSIFERLHQAFGKSGLVTIMLTGKGPNLGSLTPAGGAAEPFALARASITVWDGDRVRLARVIGKRAIRYVQRYASKGRFFLFVHFPDVDVAGHTDGEASTAYERALVDCDSWLGRIVEAVTEQGASDHTLMYVTADHGFDKGKKRHSAATHIFLGTNDPQVGQAGEQRDITPTILSAMGADLTKISPRLPGEVLGK
jgi:predicted AlkP superfamily pyrophosphatase or phosphodiesterase